MGAGRLTMTYAGTKVPSGKVITVKKYKRTYKRQNLTAQLNKMGINPPEKKRIQGTLSGDNPLGQCIGNAPGNLAYDITPQCTQGSAVNTRISNKISLTGMFFSIQLRQQAAATQPVRVDLYIIRLLGDNTQTAIDFSRTMVQRNDFVTGADIWDVYSQKNIDYSRNYQIIRKKKIYIKPDQLTGQQMPTVLTFGHKFKTPHVIRYSGASASDFESGRILMCAYSSSGNSSDVTASSLVGIPSIAVSTGQLLSYSIKYFFTDI